eukprot:COSAG06_NODE_4483_length_4210_cov_6.595817_3_plen_262_part_00
MDTVPTWASCPWAKSRNHLAANCGECKAAAVRAAAEAEKRANSTPADEWVARMVAEDSAPIYVNERTGERSTEDPERARLKLRVAELEDQLAKALLRDGFATESVYSDLRSHATGHEGALSNPPQGDAEVATSFHPCEQVVCPLCSQLVAVPRDIRVRFNEDGVQCVRCKAIGADGMPCKAQPSRRGRAPAAPPPAFGVCTGALVGTPVLQPRYRRHSQGLWCAWAGGWAQWDVGWMVWRASLPLRLRPPPPPPPPGGHRS